MADSTHLLDALVLLQLALELLPRLHRRGDVYKPMSAPASVLHQLINHEPPVSPWSPLQRSNPTSPLTLLPSPQWLEKRPTRGQTGDGLTFLQLLVLLRRLLDLRL